MLFLHGVRDAAIKDRRLRREDGRARNAPKEQRTEAEDGSYV
jgi:hypothetical protein